MEQTLSLLRKLKYVENAMFKDRNAYDESVDPGDKDLPTRRDVEMVLLDLL